MATRFALLARIKKPHRRTPGAPKLLKGPDAAADSAKKPPATDLPPPADRSPSDSEKDDAADDRKEAAEDTLTRLGEQVREAAKEDNSKRPPEDKLKDA